ncbi:MAG: hypothetical protein IKE43_08925 [Coriobacteriales bacterium]|nr:hypothetical protein [Coriobacteriales bacterium]
MRLAEVYYNAFYAGDDVHLYYTWLDEYDREDGAILTFDYWNLDPSRESLKELGISYQYYCIILDTYGNSCTSLPYLPDY